MQPVVTIRPGEAVPEGYEATSDPTVCRIKLAPCIERTTQRIYKSCCGMVNVMYCAKRQGKTTRVACHTCQLDNPT